MDDADRVLRLPDDDWQDYETSFASENKNLKETLLLSYACKKCKTGLFLVDSELSELPLRPLDKTRVIDALYNANKFTNFNFEGIGPSGKPEITQIDTEFISRFPPFKVTVAKGAYERRFRMSCSECGAPFGYRLLTDDHPLAQRTEVDYHKYEPFRRLSFRVGNWNLHNQF